MPEKSRRSLASFVASCRTFGSGTPTGAFFLSSHFSYDCQGFNRCFILLLQFNIACVTNLVMSRVSKAEIERAQKWRDKSGMTMIELAEITGYSPSAICRFELGTVPASQTMGEHAVTPRAWRRYKMICLAVDMLTRAKKDVEDWDWR